MALTQISPVILPLHLARRLTDAAIVEVDSIGDPYTVTVLDRAGNTVLQTRMDEAALASIVTSATKARTSVYFGAATSELAPAVQPGGVLATVETSTSGRLAFIAGGIPIQDADGVVIGAIGAGGGTPGQDHQVVAAGAGAADQSPR